jgi:transposase
MGDKTNQNFVDIPFLHFLEMIAYKCKLEGIDVLTLNEAHTSKCSFCDEEPVKHHKNYAGRRVERGLFRTCEGILVNADVNGALNMLAKFAANGAKLFGAKKEEKKVAWNGFNYSDYVEACSTPLVSTIKERKVWNVE